MNIYISAKWSQREALRPIAARIEAAGHKVVSSWINEDDEVTDKATAERDLQEIVGADCLILDTTEEIVPGGGGGREFEAGFARGDAALYFCRVGPVRNIFHHLVDTAYESWDELFEDWS